MESRDYATENEVARRELAELIARLDDRSFAHPVGSGWSVSSVLCHLAFWDQRALHLIGQWRNGPLEPSRFSSQEVDAINAAVTSLSLAVPGLAAARLALDSAAAVDAEVSRIGEELAGQMVAAGLERYLWRCLHRREHIQQIKQALDGQP